jgi:hypothetical protein
MDIKRGFIDPFSHYCLFIYICMLSGVVFGAVCSVNGDCTEANNECSTNCVCTSASFRNTANDACVTSRYHNRITKTEWVNEPTPVILHIFIHY